MSLAVYVLDELIKELRAKSCPVVFAAFSAGSKACLYKVVQIITDFINLLCFHVKRHYQLLRNYVSGHIYDSGPLDVTSDFGIRFALHPTIVKVPGPSKLVSWIAKCVASGFDALYLTRFESLAAEHWEALYSSANFGAPFLIFCSEKDDLVAFQSIHIFAQRLQDLGGDVNLVKMSSSSHLGHYKHHPIQYRIAVTHLLEKATSIFSQKTIFERERTGMESMPDEISELICDLQKAAIDSNQSLRRVALGPSDHFFLPSSAGYHDGRDSGTPSDEPKEQSVCLPSPPSINAHSVLGQFLFDVCVPKNIEGWDVKSCGTLNSRPFGSARRHSTFGGLKSIRRSKL
ncbi:Alpha/Beta hydrolase fold [Senna tora]|uniref:Alpha/Beta hydrolase fold n=1 Tax=Senna tora TaxID=362788 RepID=A0A834SWQ5_9FABA|nr:Alpha/Beta hydrolase fold [Senna tora]